MKEKKKTVEQTPGGDGSSVFDGVPGIPENKDVTIGSGPYSETLPVAGMKEKDFRARYSDRFDIDEGAMAIANGVPIDGEHVFEPQENILYIKHAGEKGSATVIIEEGSARTKENVHEASVPLVSLLERCGPGLSTGELILPAGIKCILSRGNITLWFWEQPPRIQQLSWIRSDSPAPYGMGTTYRNVRIALPYLIIVAVFARNVKGMPHLILKDECFFRNAPLKSLDDELLYPGLLNCSRWGDVDGMNHPLSWICTQHIKSTKKMSSKDPGERFQASFEAVRYCLLETSFNLSSEHHEGNSWYGESKKSISQINPVEQWEEHTQKDPLFVLDLPWLKSGYSLRKLAERIFSQNNAGAGQPTTADDLARLIINSQ